MAGTEAVERGCAQGSKELIMNLPVSQARKVPETTERVILKDRGAVPGAHTELRVVPISTSQAAGLHCICDRKRPKKVHKKQCPMLFNI